MRVAAASGVFAVSVVAWLWLSMESGDPTDTPDRSDKAVSSALNTVTSGSPFALVPDSADTADVDTAAMGVTPEADSQRPAADTVEAAQQTPVDVSQLARTASSDEDFDALVGRLRADPALLRQLIDEFRQEQDPQRRDRLMKLLGYAGGADVTLLASELVYSGDEQSRELGLQMLQRAQPGSAEVQQIASELLATEIEPDVLVDTLTILARPGTANTENRTLVADQVALMTSHADAAVRGISLDILSRLSTDGRDTPVLLGALTDSNARVRESAAYALVEHENDTALVRSSLLQLANRQDEPKATRNAALLALRSLTLTQEERDALVAIEQQLNTVVRPR